MCLLTTRIIKKIGFIILLIINYSTFCLFLSTHIYPSIYILIPGYILFGITLGPAWIAKLSLVVSLACKLSCPQHENNSSVMDSYDEHKLFCNREESVRRLARWYQAAQDLGIILSAIISALILSYSPNSFHLKTSPNYGNTLQNNSKLKLITNNNIYTNQNNSFNQINLNVQTKDLNKQLTDEILLTTVLPNDLIKNESKIYEDTKKDLLRPSSNTNQISYATADISLKPVESFTSFTLSSIISTVSTSSTPSSLKSEIKDKENQALPTPPYDHSSKDINYFLYPDVLENINYQSSEKYFDDDFDRNEHGEKICGINSCPVWDFTLNYNVKFNYTKENVMYYEVDKNPGAIPLMGVFLLFGIITLILTCLLGNIDNNIRYDPLKGLSDTLIFAGPMCYFIGTEQGYMLADFTKVFF